VVQGPAEQIPEATQVGVREAAKVVAERFERQPEDTKGSPPLPTVLTFFVL
jgi:hypothetical protein